MCKLILRRRLKYCPIAIILLTLVTLAWLNGGIPESRRRRQGIIQQLSETVLKNGSKVETIWTSKTEICETALRYTRKQEDTTRNDSEVKNISKWRSDFRIQRNITNFNLTNYYFLKHNTVKERVSNEVEFEQKKMKVQSILEQRRALVLNKYIEDTGSVNLDSLVDRENYFTLSKRVITPLNHRIILGNSKVCDKDQFMIVIIPSAVEDINIRRIIRETYGQFGRNIPVKSLNVGDNAKIDYVFVLGRYENKTFDREIQQESDINKDIVKADFIDSYYNLTLKVLIGLKWVKTNCQGVKYVLKVDDDVFVNIPLLVKHIESRPIPANGTVYGTIFNRKVKVSPSGKWAVKKEEYPLTFYPPYAQGTSYTLTGNLISKIVHTSQYLPYLHIEDAFITGILAGRLHGARLVHVYRSSNWFDVPPEPCMFFKKLIVAQSRMTLSLMVKTMKALTNPEYCGHGVS
ncbi:Beta-1 [Mactra antiquata]